MSFKDGGKLNKIQRNKFLQLIKDNKDMFDEVKTLCLEHNITCTELKMSVVVRHKEKVYHNVTTICRLCYETKTTIVLGNEETRDYIKGIMNV